jgi:iron complex transport system ATP-binding protein
MEHPFRVEEVVLMGRYPHWNGLQLESNEDRQKVEEILRTLNLEPLRHRRLTEISAGERQRVFLAKAIAQETPILLLDEPVAHLDLHYQIEALQGLQKLCQNRGITIILVLHDLLLASLFCDRLILLKNGGLKASGVPAEILTPLHIQEVFGVKAALEIDLPHRRLSLTI